MKHLKQCSGTNCSRENGAVKQDSLESYSKRDATWDAHRGDCEDVADIYSGAEDFNRYAERMGECSGYLTFGWSNNLETGESSLKLRKASFCRVRHCPVCQWRRSLMWQARFYQALPDLAEKHPSARWIFLTLTVKNCDIKDLRTTVQGMNAAWQRLIKRKTFAPVLGWVRTTEVTLGADGSAHPHFHALLMVPQSMLGGSQYVKQSEWVELWQSCARLDYTPVVDVRAVRAKAGSAKGALESAIAETLKYSVKPSDMVRHEAWFLEMTRQVHKLRFIATGGALKDVLRVDDEQEEDLLVQDEESEGLDEALLGFSWRPSQRKYRRSVA